MELEVYIKDWCSFCKKADALLKKRKIKYKRIDVTNNESEEADMIIRSRGCTGVPQIFAGETYIGGFNELAKTTNNEISALLKKKTPWRP